MRHTDEQQEVAKIKYQKDSELTSTLYQWLARAQVSLGISLPVAAQCHLEANLDNLGGLVGALGWRRGPNFMREFEHLVVYMLEQDF